MNPVELLVTLTTLALLGESIVETIEWIRNAGELLIQRILAVVVCELLALVTGINIFTLLNLEFVGPFAIAGPVVGVVLTGILMSRGSTWFHDLIVRLGNPNPTTPST